jgi:predicted AAA+ superfamily ATPase
MALSDAQIAAQNPWWGGSGWESRDPHLARLSRQPRRLPADLVGEIDLGRAAIHTLRGPRQVGKSTDLKLLARRALEEGFDSRRVIYLTLELLEGQSLPQVAETVRRARLLARGGAPSLVLLDEVTFVDRWQTAIKALWDDGTLDRDVVVCTGSSAVDLREGTADRLPGRRGPGLDYSVFPQSFGAFARAVDPAVPESPGHAISSLVSDSGWQTLEEMQIHRPRLDEALQLYLRFGGLPAAVAEAIGGAHAPSEETKKVVYDSLLREIQRKRASRPAAHALLERTLRSLGSKTSWTRMSREMGVDLQPRPGRSSVRDYVELLAAAYFLLVVYYWRSDSDSEELSKDKKLYFGDPLLHSVASDLAPGLASDVPAMVENAIGLALYHRYESPASRLEGFDAPADLHVWRTRRAGEIDFVCGSRAHADLVEVKYQGNPDLRGAAAIPRAFPGRPVAVATKDRLERRPGYALIPASLLLWALSGTQRALPGGG